MCGVMGCGVWGVWCDGCGVWGVWCDGVWGVMGCVV